MNWPTHEIKEIKYPKPISYKKWLLFFIVVSITLIVLFFSAVSLNLIQFNFKEFFVFSLLPFFIIFFLSFAIRIYVYSVVMENYKSQSLYIKNLKKSWSNWCDQKVNVITLSAFYPSLIELDKIINNQPTPSYLHQLIQFENNLSAYDDHELIHELLSSIREEIKGVISKGYTIKVFNKKLGARYFQNTLIDVWISLGLPVQSITFVNNQESFIEHIIEENEKYVYLFIENQSISEQIEDSFEYMSISLLSNENNKLDSNNYFYRPFYLKEDELSQKLKFLFEYQQDLNDIENIWFSGLDTDEINLIVDLITRSEIEKGDLDFKFKIKDLNLFLGVMNRNHSMFTYFVVSKSANHNQKMQLLITKENALYTFNFIK